MPPKLVPPKQGSLEKTSTEQKSIVSGIGDFFKRRHTKSPEGNTTKHDQVNATLLEKDEFGYQMPEALRKDNACLQKEDFCGVAPIRVDMEHLFDCLTMDIESAVRPEIKLDFLPDDNKWNKNYLKILHYFFSYWRFDENLDLWKNLAKKGKKGFVDFCEERINLFEKFFPLPEKYRLLAKGIVDIAYENTLYSDLHQENKSLLIYNKLTTILFILSSYSEDIFIKSHDFLSWLESEKWGFRDDRVIKSLKDNIKNYEVFKNKIEKLLKDIKSKNIPEDPRYVENKIKVLAESDSGKSSVPNEESFFEAMKKDISKYKYLEKYNLKRIRYFWREVKQQIINDTPMQVQSISVNGKDVPSQYIPAVREFLGSIVKERKKSLLGQSFAKLPNDSKIKQGLVVIALTNLVFCDQYGGLQYFGERKLNEQILQHSLGQLTEQEKMAAMCTEVKCDKGSFPLLPLLFLNCKNPWDLGSIVQEYMPKVLDIKFQIKGEGKECDIIELLEKMRAFCNKFEGKDVDEKTAHASFFESLKESIDLLRAVKEDLIFRENTKQKLHESEEKPSTSMHQVEREKLEQKQPLVIETLL